MKKEYFEILLEEMRKNFKVVAEGHTMLDRKMDGVAGELSTEITSTRSELVTMIKSSHDELEKKIVDGDRSVVEQLTKKIEDGDRAVVDQLSRKIDDEVIKLTKKIDEVKEVAKTHEERLDEHDVKIADLTKRIAP